ncbi:receptor expression-enhancing protein 6 isoform X1 [Vicugna pacos]|uniref:Receptor expression-enhancing protein 6 isoform X1 n=1 Tax=Vicugna pacos TaxID=30538 RepID=A0ABM5C6C3_VICPA
MRRGRRGRPHLLCPPCSPIGQSGGQEVETGQGAETSSGAERCGLRKAARARPSPCAGRRSNSGCQPRAHRCHGRPATALRALSGTEELGHRSARGARSQDRCRQAVLGRGSRHSAKPVSSFRLRGISAVQSHRLCVPRICFNQSYREPKQRGRHCVAHLLGGVRPVRTGRVLQRPTPVLVPFLLRGQAPRGRGQHRERPQRAGPGRGGRNNSGRPSKRDSTSESQVKSLSSPGKDLPASKLEDTSHPKSSVASSTESPAESSTSPLSPSKAAARTSASLSQSQPYFPATGSASGSQLPRKVQGGLRSRANFSGQPQAPSQIQTPRQPQASSQTQTPGQPRASGQTQTPGQPRASGQTQTPGQPRASGQTQTPGQPRASGQTQNRGQQRAQLSTTSSGPSQMAHRSSGSRQHPSTSFSQGVPLVQFPGGTPIPTQPPSKTPDGPGASVPKACKPSRQPLALHTSSSSVPELPASCQSESSLEYSSESTTEASCSWPNHTPGLHYLQHCWRLKHLAC